MLGRWRTFVCVSVSNASHSVARSFHARGHTDTQKSANTTLLFAPAHERKKHIWCYGTCWYPMESYRYTYFMWALIFLCCRCIPQSVTMINVVSHFYEPYFEIPRARCMWLWSLDILCICVCIFICIVQRKWWDYTMEFFNLLFAKNVQICIRCECCLGDLKGPNNAHNV